ncbi:ATP-binding protein [Streptomyces sp. NPDC004065]|uniref:ATP-binding protein n=1 Tax=Streptomyces sp. NPDC004065 TaxID=3364689 RepID=UPI00384D654F
MTDRIPEAVSWCLALGLFTAVVLLVRQHGITARQRRRNAELSHGLRARDAELRHLLAVRLPAVEDAGDGTAPQTGLLEARLAGTDFAARLEDVLHRFAAAVEHARSRADLSAQTALKASMRSLQALANEQQVSIARMQDRHDHPDVLRDLLEVDHTNAQFGRRAQAVAVLCGSWPGRRRAASALVEVVRGATSRIRDYRRVRVNGDIGVAVRSRAVEPVVLAIAELLDNAARHSQPHTTVEVTVQSVHNGACVVIDDAGVGMDSQAVEAAAELLSGRRTTDVTRLGDPPRFGFAVIGVLAGRYGFSVCVDTLSPYGGVRAVVLLPSGLLTPTDTADGTGPAAAPGTTPASLTPAPHAPATAPAPTGEHTPTPDLVPSRSPAPGHREPTTPGGLPRRRRRSLREAAVEPAAGPAVEVGGRSAEENARRMGAFARGTRSGRTAQSTAHADEGNSEK